MALQKSWISLDNWARLLEFRIDVVSNSRASRCGVICPQDMSSVLSRWAATSQKHWQMYSRRVAGAISRRTASVISSIGGNAAPRRMGLERRFRFRFRLWIKAAVPNPAAMAKQSAKKAKRMCSKWFVLGTMSRPCVMGMSFVSGQLSAYNI